MTTQETPQPKEKRKPYDIWSIVCAVISVFCWLWASGLEESLQPSNLLQRGPPTGGVQTAQQTIMFLMLAIRATAVTSFVTGIAGLFVFRTSRWLSVVGLLISSPMVYLFVLQAILTAMRT